MKFVAFFILILSAFPAAGQTADMVEAKRLEMKKVEKFVGKWEGSGWQQRGPKRETVTGTETVQSKLGGLALLVEGRFVDSTGAVKHETLAVISFDDKRKAHLFTTYLATGLNGEYELKVLPDSFEWGFTIPNGVIRFTTKLADDTWFEIGEFSRDGKTWVKTMEMTLKRVK